VVGQNLFIDQFNAASAEAVMEGLNSLNAPMRVVQLRVLGGAAGRVPVDATAFAHRERKIMANVAAFYQTETEKAERQAWVDALAARLRGTTPGAYVGFLGAEGPDRLHAAYPDTHWKRLAAIKQQVDPTNLFRLNHNIPPAA
jgi:FAD/FMN-containing dehydrogenase